MELHFLVMCKPTYYYNNIIIVIIIIMFYSKSPVQVSGSLIYFRGIKILEAIIQSLNDSGMSSAQEVILTGCSGTTIELCI